LLAEGRPKRQPRKAGSAKGLLTILAEDDEHLEDFKETNCVSSDQLLSTKKKLEQ
jgi:hypothetical protein